MPKQRRWAIKQRLDYAIKDVERAQAQLVGVGLEMVGIHDDINAEIRAVYEALDLVKPVIQGISDKI